MQPPSSSQHPSAPLTAIGRYQVREKLGCGAFGTVYRGYDPQLDREIALKLLNPEALLSPQAVERFQREARAAAKMHHPHIVPVHDAGQHGDQFFIASALIPGCTLAAIIPEGGLEARRAAALTAQLAEALAYAHKQGVLHRDVKPGNVMVDDQDTLYLMDFGLAAWIEQSSARMTRVGAMLGTPSYMAPEQASGDLGEVGPAADLYAAGVVLYELLTGRVPFEGPLHALVYQVLHTPPAPPSTHRPGLDSRLEAICLKAMAKRPEDRFGGGRELAAALQEWLAGQERAPQLPASPPPLPVTAVAPPTLAPDARGPATVVHPPLESSLLSAPAAPATPEWALELSSNGQPGGQRSPSQSVVVPLERKAMPAPPAKERRPSRFLPQWQPWMLLVGAISASVLGLIVLIVAIRSAGHADRPPPDSGRSRAEGGPPTTAPKVEVPLAELDKARKDAEAAWEQVKDTDRGEGLDAKLEEIAVRRSAAATFRQNKDAAKELAALEKVVALSQALQQENRRRQQEKLLAQARKDAEAAWERIKDLDRGQGFSTKLDAIAAQRQAAGELKDHAEVIKAVKRYGKDCLELQQQEEKRQEAIADRERARQARQQAVRTDAEALAPAEWKAAERQRETAEKLFQAGDMLGAQGGWHAARLAYDKAHPETIENSIGMKFVRIPKGKFWMGGGGGKPGEKEKEIEADFYLGVTEVTQGQWMAIMDRNPSYFSRTGDGKDKVKDIKEEHLLSPAW